MIFYFADKPAGCTTHTSFGGSARVDLDRDPEDGFREYLQTRLGRPLFTAHRLDRETTGAMVFGETPEASEILRRAFADRQVEKTYLFLTDREAKQDQLISESRIERDGKEFVSSKLGPVNARTRFRRLNTDGDISLWEAIPETGRSHQIRLHARDFGIPLLGDEIYGGSPFPTLCLHSASLTVQGQSYGSPPPRWFHDLRLTRERTLVRWLAAVERRERLLRSLKTTPETVRWIHSEGHPLRAEQLGDVYSLSWFGEELPPERRALDQLREILGWKNYSLQLRGNRGRFPNTETTVGENVPARWTASENGILYEFRTDTGLSPGLFLDQRQNRRWVKDHALGARVLNLFCYTAGFSVAAALGQAQKVVSVDVSRPFLEWSKVNFELNHLNPEAHEFRAIDSREYLAWAKKKGLSFDLIICDPPSFGRNREGVFKLEKDFDSLVESCLTLLTPSGRLLISLNFENWGESEVFRRLSKKGRKIERTPSPDWDFELPLQPRNMKSFFVMNDD